jgi:putative PEP-CTERM system histidine kinase
VNELAVAGFGAAALVHLAFAVYLWRAGRAQVAAARPGRLFVAAVLATAAWAGLEVGSDLYRDLAWPIGAALLDLTRYALWLALLRWLAGPLKAAGPGRRLPVVLVVLVGLALVLQVQRGLAGTIVDPPGRLVLASLLALPLAGLFLIEQLFRSLPEDSRWHAKPLTLGLAVVFAFDIYMVSQALLFGRWDDETRAARGLVHLSSVPVLFFGARRSREWIARLQVSRSVAYTSLTLMLAGLYLLILSGIGYYVRYLGGTWGGGLQLALMFGAVAFFVAVAVSGSLRSWLRVFLGKHFFSYRFDYREQWLRFTATLAARGTPQEVGEQVIRGLAHMVECPGGSLWTRAGPDAPYTQVVRWNMPRIEAEEPADSEFSRFLREKAWVVDLDEYRSAPRRYEGFALPHWLLGAGNAWLVVPLLAGDGLLGFVVLAQPRAKFEVNWEVLDLLKTASRQAATHLAQMQATEALLEARKFEAFNRMSAFVVHDLKNIVTQLSLMLKNAERLHDNREFQQDMLLTVESSLEKMRRLMLQLREGAAPPGGSRGVELEPIVRRLERLARGQGRVLEVPRIDKLATRGHEERLERVLGHLVQNALDATPPSGRVWLQAERFSGQVRIVIGDTGTGMTEEFVQTRLFKPFSSTKGSGMGVGSYESAQYLRELGGAIQVASRPGEGTVLTITLPVFETQPGSDLMRADAR